MGSGELEITIRNISTGNKQTKDEKKFNKRLWTIFSFVQQMRMRKCHLFCASMHHVPYGTYLDFNNRSEP